MKARKPFVVPALAGILPLRLKAAKGGTTNGENSLMQFPSKRVYYRELQDTHSLALRFCICHSTPSHSPALSKIATIYVDYSV